MTGQDRGGAFARPLRTIFDVGAVAGLTDGELLERFAARRGESAELAFATLLERHGPMVLRVCRKVLGDRHDALDAFQATFLVLVRRAGSVRKADSIASWLHGVAYRVAMCDRAAEARRRKHERLAAEISAKDEAEEPPDDLGPLLHRELERLPERYRAPLVLCHLQGLTHEQAADRLGWPVGTVKSRMARGRDRLKARLAGRGFDPSACLTVIRVSNPPPTVMDATARAATKLAAGQPIAGTVPASAVALMQGVLNAMMLKKIKLTVAGLMAAGIVATAAGVLAQQPEPQPVPAPSPRNLVRYQTNFVEMTGLEWRADFHPKLRTVARRGPCTVWAVDEETLKEVLGRGKVVTAPKVIADDGAKATITSESKTKFLAGFKDRAQGDALDRTEAKILRDALVTTSGTRIEIPGGVDGAFHPDLVNLDEVGEIADSLIVNAEGQGTTTITKVRVGRAVPGVASPKAMDFAEIPDGVRVQLSGHRAENGVSVRVEVESSQIVSLTNTPISEAVADGDLVLEGRISVQVPEVIESRFEGEWVVPADEALIVGLGVHSFPKEGGPREIRERLVAFKASEIVEPSSPKGPGGP